MPTPRDLVDWSVAAKVGRTVAGGGPTTTPELRERVREDFRTYTRVSDDLVRSFTSLAPAEPAPDPLVLSRGGWIDANIESFATITGPLQAKVEEALRPSGLTRRLTAPALGLQMGLLLGYLSQKVLGQYDLVLGSEAGGKVYFVGPNVVEFERRWNVAPDGFRLWITIHEITHRTQFAGVPWLRGKVQSLIARSIGAIDLDPQRLRSTVRRAGEILLGGPKAWRSVNIMDVFLSPEQRVVVDEMQALMTIVEGHGTFVMNRIGAERIPGFDEMHRIVEQRRGAGSPAERAFQRAIGMDMKYAQYSLGERFMNEVAERAGVDAVNHVWTREENLPTLDDLRDPDGWLERVGA